EEKLKSDDKDELEEAFKTLSERVQQIGAKLYESAAKEESKAEGEAPKGDDKKGEAVEGEVVDKKD
ncbi:MAG: hypothetical protein LBH36_03110, partial [Candidatus Nomurabacteria bacterium]|nr:hypothetical protein [Candidatus Nomurabacteria bacterium]